MEIVDVEYLPKTGLVLSASIQEKGGNVNTSRSGNLNMEKE